MNSLRRNRTLATVLSRLCGVALAVMVLTASSQSPPPAGPAWWKQRGVQTSAGADDFALANAGQLKNIATQALAELQANLPGGAGSMQAPNGTGYLLTQMVAGWQNSTTNADDYSAINLGQLKAVAGLFYQRLQEVGYCSAPPWAGGAADDYAVANLGQLKNVFGFDVTYSTLADGIPDWWKAKNGFSLTDPTVASADPDHDGLNNLQEYLNGTDPHNPDTDGDGFTDGEEVSHGSNPNDSNSIPLSLLTVSVSPATISKDIATPATVTVTRDVSVPYLRDLVVNYTLSGTATAGVDYASLPGSVTIPAGSGTATFNISPISTSQGNGDTTVIVTIAASSTYQLGDPASATVSLLDHSAPPVPVVVTTEAGRAGHPFQVALATGTPLTAPATLVESGSSAVASITVTAPPAAASVVSVTDLTDGATVGVTVVGDPTNYTWTTAGNAWLQADGTPTPQQFFVAGSDRAPHVLVLQNSEGLVPLESADATLDGGTLPTGRTRMIAGDGLIPGYQVIDFTTGEIASPDSCDLAAATWTAIDLTTLPLSVVTFVVPDTDLGRSYTVSSNSSAQWLRAQQESTGQGTRTVVRAAVALGMSFTLSRPDDWSVFRGVVTTGSTSEIDAQSAFPPLAAGTMTVRTKVGQDHPGAISVLLGDGSTVAATASTAPAGTASAVATDGSSHSYNYQWYQAQVPTGATYQFVDASGSSDLFEPLAQAVPAPGTTSGGSPLPIAIAGSRAGHTLRLVQAGFPDQPLSAGTAQIYTDAGDIFVGSADERPAVLQVSYAWIAATVQPTVAGTIYDDTVGDSMAIATGASLVDLSQWRADIQPSYLAIAASHWAHHLELHDASGHSVPISKMATMGYWQTLAGQAAVFEPFWEFTAEGSATVGADSWVFDLDTGDVSPVDQNVLAAWNASDAADDPDNDGLPTWMERVLGLNPYSADTDGDGIPDGVEVAQGLDAGMAQVGVSLNAVEPILVQGAASPGVVRFSRTNYQNTSDLTVNYQVSGTAVAGTDYTALSGSIVIPAGALTADLMVTPLVNPALTAPVTIDIIITASPTYGLLAPVGTELSVYANAEAGIPEQQALRLWLRANDGLPVNPDGTLSSWWDASGYTAVEVPDSVASPTLVPNSINGKPAVHFDGLSQYYALQDTMSDATQGEIFLVQRAATTTTTAGSHRFGTSTSSGSYPATGPVTDDFGSDTLQSAGTPAVDLSQFHIYNVSSAAGSWVSRIDGTDYYSSSTNNVAFTSAPTLGYDGNYFAGDVAEVLVFAKVLSPSERQQVMVYLAAKYALTSSHPVVDSDGDGLPDWWEVQYGFNPHSPAGNNEANQDPDHDGFSNLAEYLMGTDPLVNNNTGVRRSPPANHVPPPASSGSTAAPLVDSDGDGIPDIVEIQMGTNPNNPDTDGDGIPDGQDPNPTIPNPHDPTNLVVVVPGMQNGDADPDVTQIQLQWSCDSVFLTGFLIEKLDGPNGWSNVATLDASTMTWNDSGLLAGRQYAYRVHALGASSNPSDPNAAPVEALNVATVEYSVPMVRKYSQRYSYAQADKTNMFFAFVGTTGPAPNYYTTMVRHEENDTNPFVYDGSTVANTYGFHLVADYGGDDQYSFNPDSTSTVAIDNYFSIHMEEVSYRGADYTYKDNVVDKHNDAYTETYTSTIYPDQNYVKIADDPDRNSGASNGGTINFQIAPTGPLDSEQFWLSGAVAGSTTSGTASTHGGYLQQTTMTQSGDVTNVGDNITETANANPDGTWTATRQEIDIYNNVVTPNPPSTYTNYVIPFRLETSSDYYYVVHDQRRMYDPQAQYTVVSQSETSLVATFKEGDTTFTSTSTLSGFYPTSQLIADTIARLLPYSPGYDDFITAYQQPTTRYESAAGMAITQSQVYFSCAKAHYHLTFNPSIERDVQWYEVFQPNYDFTTFTQPPSVVINQRTFHVGAAGGDTDDYEIDPTTRQDGYGTYFIVFAANMDGTDSSGDLIDESTADNTGVISDRYSTDNPADQISASTFQVDPVDIEGATYAFHQTGSGLLFFLGDITVEADGTIDGTELADGQEVTLADLEDHGDTITVVDSNANDGQLATTSSAAYMTTALGGTAIGTTKPKPLANGLKLRVDADYSGTLLETDAAEKILPRSLIVDVNNLVDPATGKIFASEGKLVATECNLNGNHVPDYTDTVRVEPMDLLINNAVFNQAKIPNSKLVLRTSKESAALLHIFDPNFNLVMQTGINEFTVPLGVGFFKPARANDDQGFATARFWIEGVAGGEADIEVVLLDPTGKTINNDYVHIEMNAHFSAEHGSQVVGRHRTGIQRAIPDVRAVAGKIHYPLRVAPMMTWTGRAVREKTSASLWIGIDGIHNPVNYAGRAFPKGLSWVQAGFEEMATPKWGVPYSTDSKNNLVLGRFENNPILSTDTTVRSEPYIEWSFDRDVAKAAPGGMSPKFYVIMGFPNKDITAANADWVATDLSVDINYEVSQNGDPAQDRFDITLNYTDKNGVPIQKDLHPTGQKKGGDGSPAFDWRQTVTWNNLASEFERQDGVTRYPGIPVVGQHSNVTVYNYWAAAPGAITNWYNTPADPLHPEVKKAFLMRTPFIMDTTDLLATTYDPVQVKEVKLAPGGLVGGAYSIGHGFLQFMPGSSYELWDKYNWIKKDPTQWDPQAAAAPAPPAAP